MQPTVLITVLEGPIIFGFGTALGFFIGCAVTGIIALVAVRR